MSYSIIAVKDLTVKGRKMDKKTGISGYAYLADSQVGNKGLTIALGCRRPIALALCSLMSVAYLPSTALAQSGVTPSTTPNNLVRSEPTPELATVEEGYILGAGDRIRIDIFNVPEYSGEFLILSDGTINIPLIGRFPIQGMTLKQASDEISLRMARFLKRPIVTISLMGVRPIKIAIAGEINRPGTYFISLDDEDNLAIPTVTRAIELAGGITQAADIRRIQVRRPRPGNELTTLDNENSDRILNVNLWQLLQTADLKQDLLLRDGDSIFIPTLTSVNLNETSQLAAASFSNNNGRPLNIAVVGEVKRPGPYTIANNQSVNATTVTRAIQQAGGITQSADIRDIQVRRVTKSGLEQLIDLDLWKLLQEGDLSQDLPLQEGDTIIVTKASELTPDEATELASTSFSPETITVNVVGETIRPGVVQVPPNAPMTQALLAAGGFTSNAKKGSVELIRLNPNGTVSQRDLPVDFSEALNEDNNPALQNNDTIVVKKSGAARFAESVSPIFSVLGTVTGIFAIPRSIDGLFRLLDID